MKSILARNAIAVIAFALLIPFQALSQDSIETGEYLERMVVVDGDTLKYRIMYPEGFDESKKYPLVLFLHGAGERGNDNNRQLVHGSKLFRDSLAKYPAVVIFPQCPRDSYWANIDRERNDNGRLRFSFYDDRDATPQLAMVMDLVRTTVNEGYIDEDRVYVGGLSMGGMGTWEILWQMPGIFAAAMPICGGGAPSTASRMRDVPIWAFHGRRDDIVPAYLSARMVTAVQSAGGKAKITIYPEANHNSWDPAFAEPEFLSWMFSQKRD
jgi:predicted peptidase